MILRTSVIVFGVILQQVTAKYQHDVSSQPTIWDLFNWKITVYRQERDEITLRGLLEGNVTQHDVKIPGTICIEKEEWRREIYRPGFVMQCKCNLSSSTFLAETMSCIANSELKRGCRFATGSWRWSTSWRWDTLDDALIMLDMENAGLIIGLNVSSTEYQSCSVESLSYWAKDMNWMEASDYFFNDSKPVSFKLNNMWHLSWNVENLQRKVKESLNGKILKFQIECEKPGPPNNEDEEIAVTSCLLVKVTGKFNVTTKYWAMSQNTTVIVDFTKTPTWATKAPTTNVLLVSLLIPLCLVVLIVIVVVAVCYIRRIACFAERQGPREVAVLRDDAVQTELIQKAADESKV